MGIDRKEKKIEDPNEWRKLRKTKNFLSNFNYRYLFKLGN